MAENLPDWSMRTPSVSFLVTLTSIQLPRSGMIRQQCSLRSPAFGFDDIIDAGGAVQLADDHALGAVDDELAAADHDRHVAQVDFFLDRLLLVQPQPNAERPAIGQPQLPALVGAVARLAQLVLDEIAGSESYRSSRSGRFRAARLPGRSAGVFPRGTSSCRKRS